MPDWSNLPPKVRAQLRLTLEAVGELVRVALAELDDDQPPPASPPPPPAVPEKPTRSRRGSKRQRAAEVLDRMLADGRQPSARILAKASDCSVGTAAAVLNAFKLNAETVQDERPLNTRKERKKREASTDSLSYLDTACSMNTDRGLNGIEHSPPHPQPSLIPPTETEDLEYPVFRCRDDQRWSPTAKQLLRWANKYPEVHVEEVLRRFHEYSMNVANRELTAPAGMANRCVWWLEQSQPGGKLWGYREGLRKDAARLAARPPTTPQEKRAAQNAAVLRSMAERRGLNVPTDSEPDHRGHLEAGEPTRERARVVCRGRDPQDAA